IGAMAPDILRNTGTTDALIQVHMIPKLRSILREQGKGVAVSQDFFRESVQQQLQVTLQEGLSEFLAPKGIEVESVLMEHPDVVGAVVVGSRDGETGEAVVAHVSGDADPDELDTFVRARLSRYKCPTEYRFVDRLPIAATGKAIRRELR
ncbi:MAG: hypothetical protein R3246_14020, partial [Acidimicrobiia bacterium]|nr:hypothetical protein [Acidimicrobiia bacterium]